MPRLRSSSLIVSPLDPAAFCCFWSAVDDVADAGSNANIGFPMIAARFTSIDDLRLQVSTNSGSEFLSGTLGLLMLLFPVIDDLPPPGAKKRKY